MSSNLPRRLHGGVGKREFTRACAQFATGVAVATLIDPSGAPRGITVNSFTSVSLVPPLVLICVGHSAAILPFFRPGGHFGLSMLSESQKHLSEHFARSADYTFGQVPWTPGATGVPVLPHVVAVMECKLVRSEKAGDHDILIAEVVHTQVNGGRPLVYYGSGYRGLAP